MNALATIAIFAAIIWRLWRLYAPVEVVDSHHCGADMPPDRQDAWVMP